MRRAALFAVLAVSGCAGAPNTNTRDGSAESGGGDAKQTEDGADVYVQDVTNVDASADDGSTDGAATDAMASDVIVSDTASADVPQVDSGSMVSDSGSLISDSGSVGTDAGPKDVVMADASGTDVVQNDAACSGLSITVTAPTNGESIETCTSGGMAVYKEFAATIAGGTPSVVTFNWRHTSDGVYAPPPFSTSSAPPARIMASGSAYSARRQVGGNWNPLAGDFVPLASIQNGLGNWTFEVLAVDQAGCAVTASRPFILTFENRQNRCLNP